MNFQENFISESMKLLKHPSYRELAKMVNIDHSRIFRILNGSDMKLKEYLAFGQALRESGHLFMGEAKAPATSAVSNAAFRIEKKTVSRRDRLMEIKYGKNWEKELCQAS